jgi:DNA-binding CsgD family transcriptional regulator
MELSMNARIRTSTHPWTAAQEEELRRLARANLAPAEIAARLSRTPEQVFEHAYELGLTLPRAQPQQ